MKAQAKSTMKRPTTQKVTGVLRAAGFQATKWEWVQISPTRKRKVRRSGYSADLILGGRIVCIECCNCMNDIDAMFEALQKAGLRLDDKRYKGIIGVTAQPR